jgi:hypothetical protein
LRGGATWLVHACGTELQEYKLRRNGDDLEAERFATITPPGRVTALADSRYGVVVASDCGAHTELHRIVDGRAYSVARVEGVIGSLAVLNTSAFAVTRVPNRLDGKLVAIDLFRNAIAMEQTVLNGNMELSTDPTGSHLGIADRASGTFSIKSGSRDPCVPGMGPAPRGVEPEDASSLYTSPNPQRSPPGTAATHFSDCCCCSCQSTNWPVPPAGTPSSGHTGQPSGRRGNPCHPGQAGVPTPEGGAVVGNGGRLGRHPNAGSGQPNPCTADLMWSPRTLAHATSVYVAGDERGRNFAIVSSSDMRILDQRQLGRAGGIILADAASPTLLLMHRATGRWEVIHADRLPSGIGLDHVPVVLNTDSVTFHGLKTLSLIGGHASGIGTVKVLILPVIEAGQTFNNPDLPRFVAYLERTAFPHVRDFYRENSFGRLTDIQYQVYGVNTGPGGGPLVLPRLVRD